MELDEALKELEQYRKKYSPLNEEDWKLEYITPPPTREAYLEIAKRVLELSNHAVKGPWKRDFLGLYIFGPNNFMISDSMTNFDDVPESAVQTIRGWGDLTGRSSSNRVESHDKAVHIQKANGDLIGEYRTLAPLLASVVLFLDEQLNTPKE